VDASAKKNPRNYSVLTYVIFWILPGFTGLLVVAFGRKAVMRRPAFGAGSS
jgi:hypothetical protein